MANEPKQPEKDVPVERFGTSIVIPEGMPYRTALEALDRRAKADENPIVVQHQFDLGVAEGAVALVRALEKRYGFVSANPQGFFGTSPPEFLGVALGPGVRGSVPWGSLSIPGVEGAVETDVVVKEGTAYFGLKATVKGKHRHLVEELCALVEEEARSHSIYRGQALRVRFPDLRREHVTDLSEFFPEFAEPSSTAREDLIFSREMEALVDNVVFTPVLQTERCRRHGIPLKRGVLLEGPYGVGKTLCAAAAARACVENGWTFVYLRSVTQLAPAFEFAKRYQPCMIFAEDVDQAFGDDAEERDEAVNQILNSIDGIGAKGVEVMTILTTNNVEGITRAMLRPGRIDTVVQIRPPDAEAAARLVRKYGGEMIDANADLTRTGELLAGFIPAVIREVVERSKLAALRRPGDDLVIAAEDLEVTALEMQQHVELLRDPEKEDDRPKVVAARVEAEGRREAADTTAKALDRLTTAVSLRLWSLDPREARPNGHHPKEEAKEPVA